MVQGDSGWFYEVLGCVMLFQRGSVDVKGGSWMVQ